MTFNLYQLDPLDYDEAEPLLADYIDGAIEQFIHSAIGQAYLQNHEEVGGWISSFIELAYVYEGYTLSNITLPQMQEVMESILPRKITLLDPTEAEGAIPELVSFWQFLQRQYKLKQAPDIIKYLSSISEEFPQWMNDPSSGGFLKALLLQGHQQGFDMTSPEGLQAFQQHFNAHNSARQSHPIPNPTAPTKPPQKSESVPKAMQAKFAEIVEITDRFAATYLSDEYAQLLRAATAALCRKRPSPLTRGKANTWACGITHALGMVNFLFDSSGSPYISAGDLYQAFGVSPSTGQGKSKQVRDLLNMSQFDSDWMLPSHVGDNPLVWMIRVNGMIVDARTQPRPIQEEAYAKGLIPYLP